MKVPYVKYGRLLSYGHIMLFTLLKGFTVSISLICAIGAQNAFVLKQGLLKNNIFWVCTVCFLCDFLLMCLGVFGVGEIISANHVLLITLTLAGAIFLFTYGFLSFRSAFKGLSQLSVQNGRTNKISVLSSITATLGITLLNPHVYLDTVVIIGGVSVTLASSMEKLAFVTGTLLASLIWFYSLGYGAQKLSVYFTRPKVWQVIEFCIGVLMWAIALSLLFFLYTQFIS